MAITVAGVCSIQSGGTGGATILMTSGTGTCTVHYNQAGDANYNAASEVTESSHGAEGGPDDHRVEPHGDFWKDPVPTLRQSFAGFVAGRRSDRDLTDTAVVHDDLHHDDVRDNRTRRRLPAAPVAASGNYSSRLVPGPLPS